MSLKFSISLLEIEWRNINNSFSFDIQFTLVGWNGRYGVWYLLGLLRCIAGYYVQRTPANLRLEPRAHKVCVLTFWPLTLYMLHNSPVPVEIIQLYSNCIWLSTFVVILKVTELDLKPSVRLHIRIRPTAQKMQRKELNNRQCIRTNWLIYSFIYLSYVKYTLCYFLMH